MPASDSSQTCLDFRLTVDPQTRIFAYDLPSGRVHHFNHRAPHDRLTITSESQVVTYLQNPFASLQLLDDDRGYYQLDVVRQRNIDFLLPTARVPLHEETDRIAAVARKQASGGTASFLIALTRQLRRVFTYAPGSTNVNTTILEVLENRAGVCQDFAHLMLSICRRQGIPARYVSGYLYTGPRPHEHVHPGRFSEFSSEEVVRAAADAAEPSPGSVADDAMHAWIECLLPDGNWHGFDPTNNLITNDSYVKVMHGRDYADVAPVRGIYHGFPTSKLNISVRVTAEA